MKKIIPILLLLFIPTIAFAGFLDNLITKIEIPIRFGASVMHEIYGGTGESHYDTGDILISTSTDNLGRLGIGSAGQVLKVSGGVPVWGTDNTGAGAAGNWMFNGASTIIPTTTVGILVNASSTLADLFIDGDATTTNIDIAGTVRLNTVYYTFPSSDGANGQVLKTDSAGTLTWQNDNTAAGGGLSNWMFSGPSTLTPTSTIGIYLNSSTTIESTLSVLGASTSTDDFTVGSNAFIVKADGTIEKGTWAGTAIGDAYLTKSGDWTGTLDGIDGNLLTVQDNASSTFINWINASSTYAWASDWTTIDNYPAACGANEYVSAIGDTLTCSVPSGSGGGSNWMFPGNGLLDFITPTSTIGILIEASSTFMGDLTVGATTTSLFVDAGGDISAAGSITATGGFVGNLTGDASGNAGTATALFGDPTDCAANTFAHTIAASGNLTCAAVAASYMNDEDFGEFTCSSGTCTLDAESQGLTEMSDVTLDGPNDAEILVYQATPATAWIDVAMSGEATIDNTGAVSVVAMEGTDFGTLTDGQYCTYDQANTEIDCNSAGTAGSGGSNWMFSGPNVLTPTSTIGFVMHASSTVSADFTVGSTSTQLFVDAGGFIGLNTATPLYTVDINGSLRANASSSLANLHAENTTTSDLVIGTNACVIKADGTIEKGTWNGTAIDFSDYTNATADTGIKFTDDAIGFDCSEVEGVGINCATEAITLDATGDWTGTLDGIEGAAFLQNITGATLGELKDVSTSSPALANGHVIYWDAGAEQWQNTATTTWITGLLTRSDWFSTTSHAVIASLPSLTTIGTIGTGTWQGTAIDHERGGLEADVNAYSGLVAISGGSTSEVDAKSELEAQIADVADFCEADGDVFTGTHDFGGADDLEIPNGAAPTVDTAGQIAIDTTSDQLLVYGGAKRVLPYWNEKCFTMASSTYQNITPSDIPLWRPAKAIEITDVFCEVDGGTSIDIVISDGTNVLETITCDEDGAADDGSIANGTFTANERMEIDLSSFTGTVQFLNVCITYNITAD